MSSPVDAAGGRLPKAYLWIEEPSTGSDSDRLVPVKFNPTEYQLQKQNSFAEIGIPGLESPPIQFVRGSSEKLTTELLVDTSDTLDDVRDRYVNKLRGLLNINSELHAPPIILLVRDTQIFRGVPESLGGPLYALPPRRRSAPRQAGRVAQGVSARQGAGGE